MIDRLKENWDAIKDTLKENYDISKVSYDTWIVPMEIHNVDNDQVYILADTKGPQYTRLYQEEVQADS